MNMTIDRDSPKLLTVARAQLEVLILGRRLELILLAILFVVIVMSDHLAAALGMDMEPAHFAWRLFPMALIVALFWPLSVWAGASPSRRDYHWSLPVPRGVHDLVRVGVGGIVLMAGLAATVAFGFAVEIGGNGEAGPANAFAWANFFVAPVILYLLGSIAAVRVNRPDLWIVGIALGYAIPLMILDLMNLEWAARPALSLLLGEFGLFHALRQGMVSAALPDPEWAAVLGPLWLAPALLWLALSAAGVVAAATFRR